MRSRLVLVSLLAAAGCLPVARVARAEAGPERTPPSDPSLATSASTPEATTPQSSGSAPASSSSSSQPPRAPRPTPLLRAEATVGVGTPVGWLGAEALVAPVDLLTLHGGAGFGSQGVQLTAGARARVHTFPDASLVALGASWSTGAYAGVPSTVWPMPEMGSSHPRVYYWDQAHFVNGDVSLELKHAFRTFLGLGFVVNPHDARFAYGNRCYYGQSCSRATAELVPYLGVSGALAIL